MKNFVSSLSIKSSCSRCQKTTVSSNNKPHSLHKTKRKVYPNLQVVCGEIICTNCLKTQYKLLR